MPDFASLRARVEAYLGRPVPAQSEVLFGMHEVMTKAEADRADAETYRALMADTQHLIWITDNPKGGNAPGWVMVHPVSERISGADLFACEFSRAALSMPALLNHEPGTYACDVTSDGVTSRIEIKDRIHE